MDETINLELTTKQVAVDTVAVTVLASLAGLMAGKAVEKTYKAVITMIRLKKAAA